MTFISKYKFSIIVPSYNSHLTIEDCIKSLLDQNIEEDYEIIIVDSSEDEGVAEILKYFPKVKVYHTYEYLNVGQARNLGVKLSSGAIVVFIDSDCIAPKNWLKRILDDFNKYPQICGVLGVYTGGHSLLEKICGGEFLGKSNIGFYSGFIEGNCAFRREVFENGCSWSESTRFECANLVKCIKLKVKKPVLWDVNLKVLHLGKVTWSKIAKSGISKFNEDKKLLKLMTKSLFFSVILLTGYISLLYYLITLKAKILSLFVIPNALIIYYVLKDRMISLKYKIIFLPYLIWIRWIYWFGWIYACIVHLKNKLTNIILILVI